MSNLYGKSKKPTWVEFSSALFNKSQDELQAQLDTDINKKLTATKRAEITATDYKAKIQQIAQKSVQQILSGKKLLEVPVRVPIGKEVTTIDALNFVTKSEVYWADKTTNNQEYHLNVMLNNKDIDDTTKSRIADEFCYLVTTELGDLLGSEFTNVTRNIKGLHGYKYQYTIGDEEYTLGKICFGGNKDTVLIMITGKGCYQASEYWELNLFNFLQKNHGYLTRIDICLDDFTGQFATIEKADLAETEKKFMLTNNRPKVQQLGDWKHHTGEGRTLQVGKRENGKMFRGYEKGKQLGDCEHPWFRAEIEFKNKDRILPLEMLLHPTEYFAGAYQYCYELVEDKQKFSPQAEKIVTMKNEADISTGKAIAVMKHQFGKYIKSFREMIDEDLEIKFDKPKDTIILDLIMTDLRGSKSKAKRLITTDEYFKKLAENATKANPRKSRL